MLGGTTPLTRLSERMIDVTWPSKHPTPYHEHIVSLVVHPLFLRQNLPIIDSKIDNSAAHSVGLSAGAHADSGRTIMHSTKAAPTMRTITRSASSN